MGWYVIVKWLIEYFVTVENHEHIVGMIFVIKYSLNHLTHLKHAPIVLVIALENQGNYLNIRYLR